MHHTLTPLLTDLYQLTMAAGYWKAGRAADRAAFHLFFRKLPFRGGYAVCAGLEQALEWVRAFRFSQEDLAYLASLRDGRGGALFEAGFLEMLGALRLSVDIDAIPEGTAVFPHEPLLRVTGPILECQLLETALLNIVNFQTLIATKAARVAEAAGDAPVLEFGLRRAQGPGGAMAASRAAHIGGCAATSNVLAGKTFGIPVKGTHAHSWVMSFDSEQEAFAAYASAMPGNSTFLVDTYDTLGGVRHAIEAGHALRATGHDLAGIRLDSGDLAYLSQEARKLLDAAGFVQTAIVASNDLDESLVETLRSQGARIDVWGVGTNLVTGGAQSALGGVYKLAAIRDASGVWKPRVKLSEQMVKVSTPGFQQVRRFTLDGLFAGDAIYDPTLAAPVAWTIVDPDDPFREKAFPAAAQGEDLLVPVVREGRECGELPPLAEIRARCIAQRRALHPGIKRLLHPHAYPAGLERSLHARKIAIVEAAKSA